MLILTLISCDKVQMEPFCRFGIRCPERASQRTPALRKKLYLCGGRAAAALRRGGLQIWRTARNATTGNGSEQAGKQRSPSRSCQQPTLAARPSSAAATSRARTRRTPRYQPRVLLHRKVNNVQYKSLVVGCLFLSPLEPISIPSWAGPRKHCNPIAAQRHGCSLNGPSCSF
jgi:hypothetical protein